MRKIDRRAGIFLLFIIASAVAARLAVGLLYFNSYDTYWYRDWAFALNDGLFDIYSRADEISLDYPPVYLFYLWLTGRAYVFFGANCGDLLQMFLLKFYPILFDALCCLLLYSGFRRFGETTALCAAFCWAANPSVFFNTAYWGQTDGIMIFWLLLAFILCERGKIELSFAIFAVASMTKFQSLFFLPVLLLYALKNFGIKRFLRGIAAAAAVAIIVFLPFMIGSKKPFLFFEVYLGGADKYKFCTFNAYNLYAALGLNCVPDETAAFGGISYATISAVLSFLIIAVSAVFVLFGRRQNIYAAGFFLMNGLFVLGPRMHERYQLAALVFALAAFITTRRREFIWQFSALTAITAVNQAAVLLRVNNPDIFFSPYADRIEYYISILNVAVFIWTVYVSVKFFDLFKARRSEK